MAEQSNIWGYFRNKGLGKRANRLEREALSDPFLYEALEGLSAVKGEHELIVRQLQKEIRKKKGGRKRVLYRWLVAASFIGIGGVALWLLNAPRQIHEMALVETLPDTVEQRPIAVREFPVVQKKEEPSPSDKVIQSPVAVLSQPSVTEKRSIQEEVVAEVVEYGACEDVAEVVSPLSRKRSQTESNEASKDGQKEIRGIVTDHTGNPMAGVSLYAEEIGKGVSTDAEGHFKFRLPDTIKQLTASFVGKKTVRKTLSDRNDIQITMEEDSLVLSETVVVGSSSSQPKRKRSRERVAAHPASDILQTEDWLKKFEGYVADSLRYPEDARLQKIEGTVIVSVVLNKHQRPSRIKILHKLYPSCDREAVRLVKKYKGTWGTGERNLTLNIPFQLPDPH